MRSERSRRAQPPPVVSRSRRVLLASAVVALALFGGAFWYFMRSGGGAGDGIGVLRTADFHALVISPENPDLVFFGHHNGLMRSEDAGRTWRVQMEQRNFDSMGLAIGRAAPNRLYVAGHDVLQVSSDGGETWQPIASDLPGTDIHALAMNSDDPNRLYAWVAGQGMFRSADGGRKWQPFGGVTPADITGLLALGTSPEQIYIASARAGVLRGIDGDGTFSPAVAGLDTRPVLALAADLSVPGTLYAGTNAGLYKSEDAASTWRKVPFPGANAVAVATSPTRPGRVLAIAVRESRGYVHRSDDGGQTWDTGG